MQVERLRGVAFRRARAILRLTSITRRTNGEHIVIICLWPAVVFRSPIKMEFSTPLRLTPTPYEAVAHAVAEFRAAGPIKATPSPTTEFTVTVYRKPVEHRIRLTQVERWAEHTTKEGPSGITKRERVRKLLGPTS